MAQKESLIQSFPSGSNPGGMLSRAKTNALYGTTYYGGSGNYGTIFEVKRMHGRWRDRTIFSFNGSKGAYPYAGVTAGAGTLYGTTEFDDGGNGYGTVYSLAGSGSKWTETVLHKFALSDGANPINAVTYDPTTGNLYGTTWLGGAHDYGTAFELAPSGGSWSFKTIYNFQGGADACEPQTMLREGRKTGTLFGAADCGTHNAGTVFQLRERGARWRESICYSFTGGSDGANPVDIETNAQFGSDIYGVTNAGGEADVGVMFILKKASDGWHEAVLHAFAGSPDGAYPVGLTFDSTTGEFYGTTQAGGAYNEGAVFKLSRQKNSWVESVLYSFGGYSGDGVRPQGSPIRDKTTGILYGTTSVGGKYDGGTLWTITQ